MSLSSVKVHSSVALDAAVFAILRPETGLLVNGCPVTVTYDEWMDTDADGVLQAYCATNHALKYDLEGKVLVRGGLADYFPGMELDAAALRCANAEPEVRPFHFDNTRGRLFYGAPVFSPRGGGLPEFSCEITLRFGGYRGSADPGGGSGGSGSSFTFLLAPQPVFRFTGPVLAALLRDVFHAETNFSGSLTFTMFNGLPGGGGSVVYAETAGGVWSEEPFSTPVEGVLGSLGNSWAGNVGVSVFNYCRIRRGSGQALASVLLSGVVTVPSGKPLAISAGTFRAALAWPVDGVTGAGPYGVAGYMARYMLGAEAVGVAESDGNVYVQCFDGDPDNGGTLLDAWTVARTAGVWTVADNGDGTATAENAGATAGSDTAPVGGWVVRYVTAGISGVNYFMVKRALPVPLEVAEGGSISLAAGVLTLTVS